MTCSLISFHDNHSPDAGAEQPWCDNLIYAERWVPLSHLPHNREPQPGGGSITNLTSNLILLMMYLSQPLKMPVSNANAQLGLGFN